MRIVKVPGKVSVAINTNEGEKNIDYSFLQFCYDIMLQYRPFGEGRDGAVMYDKLRRKVADMGSKGRTLILEDAEWESLKACAAKPQLLPAFNASAIPFYDAINNADQPIEKVSSKK